MSHKATCPGCNSHTSAVWMVLQGDEEACPYCGLSRAAMLEVLTAQERGANADLTERYTQATIRADRAESEVRELRRRLSAVEAALEE